MIIDNRVLNFKLYNLTVCDIFTYNLIFFKYYCKIKYTLNLLTVLKLTTNVHPLYFVGYLFLLVITYKCAANFLIETCIKLLACSCKYDKHANIIKFNYIFSQYNAHKFNMVLATCNLNN